MNNKMKAAESFTYPPVSAQLGNNRDRTKNRFKCVLSTIQHISFVSIWDIRLADIQLNILVSNLQNKLSNASSNYFSQTLALTKILV